MALVPEYIWNAYARINCDIHLLRRQEGPRAAQALDSLADFADEFMSLVAARKNDQHAYMIETVVNRLAVNSFVSMDFNTGDLFTCFDLYYRIKENLLITIFRTPCRSGNQRTPLDALCHIEEDKGGFYMSPLTQHLCLY